MRSTYVWAALVAGLAGYVVYDYRHQDADKLAPGEVRAFSFPRDQVTRFTLTRGEQTIQVERHGDEWRLAQPLEDDAEDTVVDGFLFALEMERLREFRDADDHAAPDWARYGLDHPSVTVEWASAKSIEKIEVSTKNAFDGSFYVRKGDRLLLGQAGLAQATNRSVGSFRSRRIWRHADADVNRVEVKAADPRLDFTLTRDGHGWGLSPKPKYTTDPERIDKWVNAVEDLTAAEFIKEGLAPADLKTYGLDHPRLKISVDYQASNEKPGRWTLTVGPERGADVYFFTNDRAVILKATAAAVKKLVVAAEYFRDGHPPFQFDVERARELRARVGGVARVITRGEAGWALKDPGPGESVNETELTELMTAARGLEAVDFSAGHSVKGPPLLEVLDAEGRALLRLVVGDEYQPRTLWTQGAALKAVRVTNPRGEDTFGLPKAQIETLIKERLIKKAPAAAAAPK